MAFKSFLILKDGHGKICLPFLLLWLTLLLFLYFLFLFLFLLLLSFITVVIISFLLFAVVRVDFNFKKLITKPSLGSKKKSQGVVSFRDGGQVKLGVPGMAPDAGSPTEMDQVPSSQKDRGWGEWGNLGKSGESTLTLGGGGGGARRESKKALNET